ncbi:unnamed protein product [Protopolystoma xenopodis]|uniref:Uncharacterized protein n=1 Tax=Protopolystoma xenopodis TaxID=117903 RepID=A0A3S5BU64_9PLAT|nr:unnamed protein product [Protopolystoma xenopodis]
MHAKLAGTMLTSGLRNLPPYQLRRRQRQLLSLLVGAVERLHSFDPSSCFSDPSGSTQNSQSNSHSKHFVIEASKTDLEQIDGESPDPNIAFRRNLGVVASWLANASQLLHLVTRDVDLTVAFQPPLNGSGGSGGSDMTSPVVSSSCIFPSRDLTCLASEARSARAAWTLLTDRLAEVVQLAFDNLSVLAVEALERISLPILLDRMQTCVDKLEASQLGEVDTTACGSSHGSVTIAISKALDSSTKEGSLSIQNEHNLTGDDDQPACLIGAPFGPNIKDPETSRTELDSMDQDCRSRYSEIYLHAGLGGKVRMNLIYLCYT